MSISTQFSQKSTASRTLDSIARTHIPGIFCESAIARDILDYYGLSLNGATVFGLSGVLGFTFVNPYSHLVDLPHATASGINNNPTLPLLNNLGLEWKRYDQFDFETCIDGFSHYFEQNIPIMIRVSFFDYYSRVFKDRAEVGNQSAENIFSVFEKYLPYNTGLHYILGVGLNKSKGELMFIENLFNGIYSMPLEVLREAMNNGQKMSAVNEWTVILPFDQCKIGSQNVLIALHNIAQNLLNSTDYRGEANNGLLGLQKFIDSFFTWPEHFESNELKEHLALLFLAGGGVFKNEGFYRTIASKFFNYAQSILKDERLSEVGKLLKDLGSNWYRFMSRIPIALTNEINELFSGQVRAQLNEIYATESKCAHLIEAIVNDYIKVERSEIDKAC